MATGETQKGKRPLEDTPSDIAYVLYTGIDGAYTGNEGGDDGHVNEPLDDFGFPFFQAVSGIDTGGNLFDTTDLEITPNGKTIHYSLRLVPGGLIVGDAKPYTIHHDQDGRYTSKGATINFEVGDEGEVPPPFNALLALLPPGEYRLVVNDIVQLTERGGAFDWATTRADFYHLEANPPQSVLSLLYVLWDYDEEAGDPGVSGDVTDPTDNVPPDFPSPTIAAAAENLITDGVANLGGH